MSLFVLPRDSASYLLKIVQKTVKFINDEASSVHGSLKSGTIYTSESGEWKLGGLEVLSSMKDDEAIIYVCTAVKMVIKRIMLTWNKEFRKSCTRFRTIYTT